MEMEKYAKAAVVVVLCILAASTGFLLASLPRGLQGPSDYIQPTPSPAYPERGMEEKTATEVAPAGIETPEVHYTDTERKIIQTASLSIEVEDFQSRSDSVIAIGERYNGFISDSHTYVTDTGRKRGVITIRVPTNTFLVVIEEIERVGTVKSKDTSGKDVTEEYIDLTARLNNFERQERRLLDILDMANTTTDVLEVERELWRVRGEIEWLTGQINYLENRVELATVSVSLYEPEPITHSWGIRDALRSAFVGFVSVIRGLIILTGYALPLVILVCIAWLVKSKVMPGLRKERKGNVK